MKRGPVSEETRRKLAEAHRGKTLTSETRHKISEAARNRTPETRRKLSEAASSRRLWETRRGRGPASLETRRKMSESAKKRGPNPITLETRRKMSQSARGKKLTLETRTRIAEANKRRGPQSLETRRKRSESLKGPRHWNWKGGITPRNRHSIEYAEWHRRVFKRDNYMCRKCGTRGGELHAHHLAFWGLAPAKRYDVENGITLCIPCHKKLHGNEGESK